MFRLSYCTAQSNSVSHQSRHWLPRGRAKHADGSSTSSVLMPTSWLLPLYLAIICPGCFNLAFWDCHHWIAETRQCLLLILILILFVIHKKLQLLHSSYTCLLELSSSCRVLVASTQRSGNLNWQHQLFRHTSNKINGNYWFTSLIPAFILKFQQYAHFTVSADCVSFGTFKYF